MKQQDSINLSRISLLHPDIRTDIKTLVDLANSVIAPILTVRIVQGLRTIEEQNILYAQGRTTPGSIVTNARGGASPHNYGLAIDFAFIVNGKDMSWDTVKDWDNDKVSDWLEVVQIFIKAGYVWGGNFHSIIDKPHFEHKSFSTIGWRELLNRYNTGKITNEIINNKTYKYVKLK